MDVRNRKSSAHIALVLIGAISLTACDQKPRQQDVYANLNDCVKDWNKLDLCSPAKQANGEYYYLGPSYAHPWLGNKPRQGSRAISSQQVVTRSGFGSSSRSRSSFSFGG